MSHFRKEAKQKLKQQLREIEEDKIFISEFILQLVSGAESDGQSLLAEKDKHRFIERLGPVKYNVEKVSKTLRTIRTSLQQIGEKDSSSEDSDSESDVTTTNSKTNQAELYKTEIKQPIKREKDVDYCQPSLIDSVQQVRAAPDSDSNYQYNVDICQKLEKQICEAQKEDQSALQTESQSSLGERQMVNKQENIDSVKPEILGGDVVHQIHPVESRATRQFKATTREKKLSSVPLYADPEFYIGPESYDLLQGKVMKNEECTDDNFETKPQTLRMIKSSLPVETSGMQGIVGESYSAANLVPQARSIGLPNVSQLHMSRSQHGELHAHSDNEPETGTVLHTAYSRIKPNVLQYQAYATEAIIEDKTVTPSAIKNSNQSQELNQERSLEANIPEVTETEERQEIITLKKNTFAARDFPPSREAEELEKKNISHNIDDAEITSRCTDDAEMTSRIADDAEMTARGAGDVKETSRCVDDAELTSRCADDVDVTSCASHDSQPSYLSRGTRSTGSRETRLGSNVVRQGKNAPKVRRRRLGKPGTSTPKKVEQSPEIPQPAEESPEIPNSSEPEITKPPEPEPEPMKIFEPENISLSISEIVKLPANAIKPVELNESSVYSVWITEIFNPSLFWVQLQDMASELENFMDELRGFYDNLPRDHPCYKLSENPKAGQLVVARYGNDERWYRARIHAVWCERGLRSKKVEVLYVDYGNRATLTLDLIKPLHPQFIELPSQSFPCAMSKVAPVSSGFWVHERDCMPFANFVLERNDLSIRIVSTQPSCPLTFVELYCSSDGLEPRLPHGAMAQSIATCDLHRVVDIMKNKFDMRWKLVNNAEWAGIMQDRLDKETYDVTNPALQTVLHEARHHALQQAVIVHSSKSSEPGDKEREALVIHRSVNQSTSRHISSGAKGVSAPRRKSQCSDELNFKPNNSDKKEQSNEKEQEDVKRENKDASTDRENTAGKTLTVEKITIDDERSAVTSSPGQKITDDAKKPLCPCPDAKDSVPYPTEKAQAATSGTNLSTNNEKESVERNPAGLRQVKRSGQKTNLELRLPRTLLKQCQLISDDDQSSIAQETNIKQEKSEKENTVEQRNAETENPKNELPNPDTSQPNNQPNTDQIISVPSPRKFFHLVQPVQLEEDNSFTFLISHIASPSEFWVHPIQSDAVNTVNQIMEELNDYFSSAPVEKLKRFYDEEFAVGQLVCAKFSEDGRYYRAEITEMKQKKRRMKKDAMESPYKGKSGDEYRTIVQVYYVDFGNSEHVDKKRILPLPVPFRNIPGQAVCCSMYSNTRIAAVNEGGDAGSWSPEAVADFEAVTGYDRILLGYVMNSPQDDKYFKSPVPDSSSQNTIYRLLRSCMPAVLDLVVVDTSSDDDVWINENLSRLGIANFHVSEKYLRLQSMKYEKHRVPDMNPEQDELDEAAGMLQDWNPMGAEFLAEDNSYHVNRDDPAVATLFYKGEDERKICKFYGRPGKGRGCWRGDACPYEHIEPDVLNQMDAPVTRDVRPVFCTHDVENSPQPKIGDWLVAQVSYIFDPGHFYVTFPYGVKSAVELVKEERQRSQAANDEGYSSITTITESVELLSDAMNEHYSRITRRDTDLITYAIGEMVAAPYKDTGNWHRARVIGSVVHREISQSKVKVFYVDFGGEDWLPESVIRQMQPQFMHLPFQAVECFLPIEPTGNSWPLDATQLFKEMVEGKILYAHVKYRYASQITADLINTSGENEINIGGVLVARGYAMHASSRTRSRATSSAVSHTSETQAMVYMPG